MSRSLCSLAASLAVLSATPALAYHGEGPACEYCELFPYKPLRLQIEGGYTVTQGWGAQYLDNGTNMGLGITWQPSAAVPVALRADGAYMHFDARQLLLDQAAAHLGRPIDDGNAKLWGGDIDAELYLKLSSGSRLYFVVGAGRYDEQNSFHEQGMLVSRNTTGTHSARNAGLGLEFGNGGSVFFFVDARYLRISASGHDLEFVPIRLGLRF